MWIFFLIFYTYFGWILVELILLYIEIEKEIKKCQHLN
jgi:hypothetical protein